MEAGQDSELVARSRRGERGAFDALVARHSAAARRTALGMVACGEVAEDLAQEALLQAYLCLDRLRDGALFRGWLCGIARNVCRSYLRSRKAELLTLDAGGFDPGGSAWTEDPQEVVEERERRRGIAEAMEALTPQGRAVLRLFYYEQMSAQEIAERLGTTPGAVRVSLHKSRRQLRGLLDPGSVPVSHPEVSTRRRKKMVPVTLEDVVQNEKTLQCVALLVDRTGERALPVWIGNAEAVAIATELARFPVARPLTVHFMASLLEAAGGRLEEVGIVDQHENTYHAVAKVRVGERVVEVDARPSDVLALAVRVGAPVYVTGEILERMALRIGHGEGEVRHRLGEDFASLKEAYTLPPEPDPSQS